MAATPKAMRTTPATTPPISKNLFMRLISFDVGVDVMPTALRRVAATAPARAPNPVAVFPHTWHNRVRARPYACSHGQGEACCPVLVHGMRLLRGSLVREVPGLQRVRHARRGGCRAGLGGLRASQAAPATRRRPGRRGCAYLDRSPRARPRARRRARARVTRTPRR